MSDNTTDIYPASARAAVLAHIRARVETISRTKDAAELEYSRLEEEIKRQQRELAERGRQLDTLHGAMQELTALYRELSEK